MNKFITCKKQTEVNINRVFVGRNQKKRAFLLEMHA